MSLPAEGVKRRAEWRKQFACRGGKRLVFAAQGPAEGLNLPLECHSCNAGPAVQGHFARASRAEAVGFSSLWLRDIPFHDPEYGDVGLVYEPMFGTAPAIAIGRTQQSMPWLSRCMDGLIVRAPASVDFDTLASEARDQQVPLRGGNGRTG